MNMIERELIFDGDFVLHVASCSKVIAPKPVIRDTVLLGVPIVTKHICADCLPAIDTLFITRQAKHNSRVCKHGQPLPNEQAYNECKRISAVLRNEYLVEASRCRLEANYRKLADLAYPCYTCITEP